MPIRIFRTLFEVKGAYAALRPADGDQTFTAIGVAQNLLTRSEQSGQTHPHYRGYKTLQKLHR